MYDFLLVINRDHSSKLLSFLRKSRFCVRVLSFDDRQTDGQTVYILTSSGSDDNLVFECRDVRTG